MSSSHFQTNRTILFSIFTTKKEQSNIRKRLIGGIVAASILIPTAAAFAIDMLTRTPMTARVHSRLKQV
ncbi:hypothetical protein D8Z77_18145 [Brevibacillus laterosporus]|nr:hypothetical protein D8Z77_18145 [Brevibacillus laterosporus]